MDEVTKARLELEQSIFTTPEIIQRELEVFLSKTVAKATEMTKRSHAGGEHSAVHCEEAGDLAAVMLTAMANHGRLSTGTVVAAIANIVTILGVASRSAPQTQTLAETMTMTVALLEMMTQAKRLAAALGVPTDKAQGHTEEPQPRRH